MTLKLALTGNLERIMAEERAIAERAVTSSVKRAAGGLQREYRRQVRRAGLGTGVEKAWQLATYPRGRGKRARSLNAAALVFSKATRIHDAFSANRTIRARGGRYLVIPLEAAVARGWDRSQSKSESTSQPRRWANIEAAENALGRLAFVPLDRSRALLVHRRGRTSTAYFLLVKEVRLRKRLDQDGPAEKWAGKVPGYIAAAYERAERRRQRRAAR